MLSERLLFLWLRFSKKLQITSLIRCELQMAGFLSKGWQYSITRLKERKGYDNCWDGLWHAALYLTCKSWVRESCAKFSFKLTFLVRTTLEKTMHYNTWLILPTLFWEQITFSCTSMASWVFSATPDWEWHKDRLWEAAALVWNKQAQATLTNHKQIGVVLETTD